MGEVVGIVLNQVFGDDVDVCHNRCSGSEGWRLSVTHTTVRIPANIRPMSQHRVTNGMDSIKYPYYVFKYAVLRFFFQLEFQDYLFGAEQFLYILIDK